MKKAIIFDFDGVLSLSEVPRFNIIQKEALKYGVVISDSEFKKMEGRLTIHFLNNLLKNNEKKFKEKIIYDYEKEYKSNITKYAKPIPQTVNFIKNYKGPLKLAIASMSSKSKIETLINHFGISSKFNTIISKEDVLNSKPDPEIYIKTAKFLKLKNSECIVIEDTKVGVESAINAKMDCYVFLNGLNNKLDFLDSEVKGFITTSHDLKNIN